MNDNVHPIFRGILSAISGDLPERPLHPPARPAAPEFNVEDYSIVHDVMGNDRLAKPMQELLETLAVIELTIDSFGADKARAFDRLYPLLKDMRQALKEQWEEIR